jgi:hypothetical protein
MSIVLNSPKKIFHFHFYKNAGSSFDSILRDNFINQWVEKEFANLEKDSKNVINWIKNSNELNCFSSHTAKLDIINSPELNIFPVLFVRHPIDRIASVYKYEKIQQSQHWEHVLAKNSSMREYIQARLAIEGDAQCRNFHIHRLAETFRFELSNESIFQKAARAVDQLPFIGVVEKFQDSLNTLSSALEREGHINLKFIEVRENSTSSGDKNLITRLQEIENELGKDFYEYLNEINKEDILIYEKSVIRLHQKGPVV